METCLALGRESNAGLCWATSASTGGDSGAGRGSSTVSDTDLSESGLPALGPDGPVGGPLRGLLPVRLRQLPAVPRAGQRRLLQQQHPAHEGPDTGGDQKWVLLKGSS